jgi:uncharacterized protein YndB with AHSA1/START domain
MPEKRNDVEESKADREIAFTRVISAWVLVLVILFGVTTPSTENRSIGVSIRGSLGGGASAQSEGECAADTETIRTSQAIPREFNTPRRLIWEAWTNPKQVSLWWWPQVLTTTIEEMDLRTGGMWRLVIHGPNGTDNPNKNVFTELVPFDRLGYTLSGGKRCGPTQFEITTTFAKEGGTRLTMRMVFGSGESRDQNVREYGSIAGGKTDTGEAGGPFVCVPFS